MTSKDEDLDKIVTYDFIRQQYENMFDKFDKNNDGVFQEEELMKLAKGFVKVSLHMKGMMISEKKEEELAQAGVKELFNMFDDNKDGRIERTEFAEAYMRISGFDTDHKSTYWSEARATRRVWQTNMAARFPDFFDPPAGAEPAKKDDDS